MDWNCPMLRTCWPKDHGPPLWACCRREHTLLVPTFNEAASRNSQTGHLLEFSGWDRKTESNTGINQPTRCFPLPVTRSINSVSRLNIKIGLFLEQKAGLSLEQKILNLECLLWSLLSSGCIRYFQSLPRRWCTRGLLSACTAFGFLSHPERRKAVGVISMH